MHWERTDFAYPINLRYSSDRNEAGKQLRRWPKPTVGAQKYILETTYYVAGGNSRTKLRTKLRR
jgi:hypothetical protein